jgi:hypothetical protein
MNEKDKVSQFIILDLTDIKKKLSAATEKKKDLKENITSLKALND